MKHILLIISFLLTACSGLSKYPGGGVGAMSADTLCWRSVYAAAGSEIEAEIAARGLDCAKILEN